MADDGSSRKRLGDFEIIRELGRGGMGIVYEARQISLNRKVALKVISAGLGLSSKAVLRFQREAEAAGKLHHTNIVPIYSTGHDGGAHYYAMELIDGPSLHQVIRSLRRGDTDGPELGDAAATMAVPSVPAARTDDSVLDSSGGAPTPAWLPEVLGSPPALAASTPSPGSTTGLGSTSARTSSGYFDSVATVIAGVAEALDYAHENGVIHRDIKPANLLLSRDGRVSINDFGLARVLEQPGMTMSGEFVGSPLYMSPEQITAGRAPLDHRTDVYSLGATLYELLTLGPVFSGQSRDEVIAQILHKEPDRPRRQNPKVPIDLETICLKAMEKDPDRRYQTAGQLAADLRRFVDRHAISARRVGPAERALRWARKNRAVTVMACVTLAVTLAAAVYIYISDRERERIAARDHALTAALSGDSATAVLEIQRAGRLGARNSWINMILGQVDRFEGRSQDALSKFKAAAEDDPESVMAQAMLTESCMANGLLDAYVSGVARLEGLAGKKRELSSEDLLFLGIALLSMSPEKALQAIESAANRRSSFTLAAVWQAHVRTVVAQNRGDKGMVLDALADFEYLRRFHPELEANPLFNDGLLNARIAASRLCLREQDREQAKTFLLDAESNVRLLATFPKFLTGNWRRLHYFEFTEDLDAMKDVMKDLAASQGRGYIVGPFGAAFFGLGKDRADEALEELEGLRDRSDSWALWTRVLLLSESAAGRRKASELLDGFLAEHPRDSEAVEDVFSVLYLRGQRRDAVAYVKDRATRLRNKKSKYLTITRDALEYLSGGVNQDDLLRPVKSESEVAFLYFAVGLRLLTTGNRSAARTHFEKSGASAVYYHSMSTWSRALAARIDRDQTWPEWLPSGPVDADAK